MGTSESVKKYRQSEKYRITLQKRRESLTKEDRERINKRARERYWADRERILSLNKTPEAIEKRRQREKKRYEKDPEKARKKSRETMKRCYEKNPEKFRTRVRMEHYHLRMKLFEIYGYHCFCCGEDELDFLELDHINGGGARAFRRMGTNTRAIYRMAIEENDKTKYRILCGNCNKAFGKTNNKIIKNRRLCPHQVKNLNVFFRIFTVLKVESNQEQPIQLRSQTSTLRAPQGRTPTDMLSNMSVRVAQRVA